MPPASQELLCDGESGCVGHRMHHTLPPQCHSQVLALRDTVQGRVWLPTPPRRPLVSPGQQGSGMSHVRLLQRLAGDT